MKTEINRKCKTCHYFSGDGWCLWLGKKRNPNQSECEDGYCRKDKNNISPFP